MLWSIAGDIADLPDSEKERGWPENEKMNKCRLAAIKAKRIYHEEYQKIFGSVSHIVVMKNSRTTKIEEKNLEDLEMVVEEKTNNVQNNTTTAIDEMFHRGQESQPGYMDGIFVKISEKYKPPPRINLAVTYSQRLSLNQQIQDNMTCHEFTLEKNIKEKVNELKNARKLLQENNNDRGEIIKEARLRFQEVRSLKNEKNSINNKENELFLSNKELSIAESNQVENETKHNNDYSLYSNSYSHILMPTPLISTSQILECNSDDRSPLNIEEFEADTSSPFDNMELKSINDIEVLAQVLKRDKSINSNSTFNSVPSNQTFSNFVPTNLTTQPSSYLRDPNLATISQYSTYNIPQSNLTTYGQPISTPMYNNVNGYYYRPSQTNHSFETLNFNLNRDNVSSNLSSSTIQQAKTYKNPLKTVPDIMKSLQAELNNTHIHYNANQISVMDGNHHDDVSRNNKVDINSENVSKMTLNSDNYDYDMLPANLKSLSKNISSMGFPLSRVARACQLIGDDQKKVVDHLLAMSELLGLGFSEKDVSTALLKCNNDRDQALDILIS